MYCCSIATSGSLKLRPANRVRQLTVFLRLEISWFFAGSPMYLLLGPNATKDLYTVSICAAYSLLME